MGAERVSKLPGGDMGAPNAKPHPCAYLILIIKYRQEKVKQDQISHKPSNDADF